MTYAGGRVIHDADAHIMETADWLVPYADPDVRDRLEPVTVDLVGKDGVPLVEKERERHADPATRATLEQEILLHKNWGALGSFIAGDRPQALDRLGFRSQLLFNTFTNGHLVRAEHSDADLAYGMARAHNRAMVDFCSSTSGCCPSPTCPCATSAGRASSPARPSSSGARR